MAASAVACNSPETASVKEASAAGSISRAEYAAWETGCEEGKVSIAQATDF